VALALPSVHRIGQVHHQATHVEGRADLEQSLDRLVTRVGAKELRASRHLSSEGAALTPLAWRLDVPPQSLRGTRIPGLRVALRDRRWRPFWQEVHRRGFRGRTVFRDGRLFLISIERH
jgi:hypothetical protein